MTTQQIFTKIHRGDFGKKLRENICFDDNAHFILNTENKCPFFNQNKLCDIYINLGKDSLCKICAEHPRYYEWFHNVKEGGIGLCCEEAARIILSQNESFSTYELDIPDEDVDEYDIDFFSYLYNCREKILSYLDNSSISLNSRICDILWYSYTIQQDIDNNLLDDEDIFGITSYSKSSIKSILAFLLELEPNDSTWPKYLTECLSSYNTFENSVSEFEKACPEIDIYLKNISIYFIWRYFLKGVFDEDILSKVKLMVISIAVLKYLFFCKWEKNGTITLDDCIEIVNRYSEEIEYSNENLDMIANSSYEINILSVENLLGLF